MPANPTAPPAGRHLIVDLYGASRLDEPDLMQRTLQDCVRAAGATLLHLHVHRFEANGGLSAVAVLAESHIAVHSWPESGYAACDIFMCGAADPQRTLAVLQAAFNPKELRQRELLRGPAGASSTHG